MWVGVGGLISEVMATFNHADGSFNHFKWHHQGCLNNSIFSNSGLSQIVANFSESSLLFSQYM